MLESPKSLLIGKDDERNPSLIIGIKTMATATVNSNSVATAQAAVPEVAIATPATATPLSVKLATILGEAKKGGNRYLVASRKTPVLAGVLAVYNTSVYDTKGGAYYDIVAAKPVEGGRAIVLGQMSDRGLDLCPSVKLNADILSAVARANSSWAETLKVESKQTRLNAKLDAIAEYFSADNGAFVDL
jgi:hypothetical protein